MLKTIGDEIAQPFKLKAILGPGLGQPRLKPRIVHYAQRIGIQKIEKIRIAPIGRGIGKQAIVEAHSGRSRGARIHPVDHAPGLDPIRRIAAQSVLDQIGNHRGDGARCVALHSHRFDHIGMAQANPLPQHQALELLVGCFAEVLALDIHAPGKRQHPLTQILALGMSGRRQWRMLVRGIAQLDE